MEKSSKYRPSSRSPERRDEGDYRYEKHYKKYDEGSDEEYSGHERSSRAKNDEYYREKERRKREKEEKKERRRREKEQESERSHERSPQGQNYQPPSPHGQHYGAQPGYGYQAPPYESGYPATTAEYPGRQPSPYAPPHESGYPTTGTEHLGRQPSPYAAGAYPPGGYQPPPPAPQGHPPSSPGYGGFQGPPASPGYATGGFQGYPPPPGPPPASQPYSGYSGGSAPYSYPPPPPPPQQEYVAYGQPGYGQPQHPVPPHQPPNHPAASQGYSAYISSPPPPKVTAGGATGGQHYKPQHHSAQQQQAYYGHGSGSAGYPTGGSAAVQFENTNPANPHSKPSASSGGTAISALESFTSALTSSLHSYARTLFPATSTHKPVAQYGPPAESGAPAQTENRFDSFAREKVGNGIKWYVDGKDYMYAVSIAIENARQSIWILDWWLSPELYLRRPPKLNEQYRIDVMLKAAAERGVKVNIIVYKEVPQALTLDSHHTKTSLEKLHPNITVYRHPDHLPDKPTIENDIWNKVTTGTYQLGDGLKGLYGMKDGVTLYWAHHEKLCLVDGEIAFMGGLDLCFGRWDMNHHPIADAHPTDLRAIIFPGQDYNNSRFMDFHNVDHWEENKLKREEYSRMGWSDVALSLIGPSVKDLQRHFIERWNFIYYSKYQVRQQEKFQPLDDRILHERGRYRHKIKDKVHHVGKKFLEGDDYGYDEPRGSYEEERAYSERRHDEVVGVRCQIVRSASKWSHGLPATEHSIAHAYIEIISTAKHFIYIENQFFITATDDKQSPILNKIGRAIMDRIIRADRERQKFKMIIVIPAIPAFAGDLKHEGSLGTRAIMEFQYRSINNDRGYSIMEQIAKAGVDPKKYIRFYNLRNYDRINAGRAMAAGEASSAPRSTVGPEWDSVSQCVMLGGGDIRSAPWNGDAQQELDAYVSEELYVHTKLLIADDRIVICGSANLNDRSQLGDHDSEIAIIIEDPTPLPSLMDSRPYQASHFAATLRRQIFRKHLGLIPAANLTTVDENMHPVPIPNIYDFDSQEDLVVTDPLSDTFENFWNYTARTNTVAFEKVFHVVPTDKVANWKDYDEYWGKHFRDPLGEIKQPKIKWGHIVRDEFNPDPRIAIGEVKNVLATVRGNLVEMPLGFLREEDIAKEGLGLNAITEILYT